jgi:hypothetical protein
VFGAIRLAVLGGDFKHRHRLPCQLAGAVSPVVPDFVGEAGDFVAYVHNCILPQ